MPVISIKPSNISGIIKAPPSKSLAHRALFCAALSGEPCTVSNVGVSEDVKATISCLSKMGTLFTVDGNSFLVDGKGLKTGGRVELNCKESGATIRFAIPAAAALGLDASFYGSGNLPNRSVDEFIRLLPQHGVRAYIEGGEILSISGKLTGSEYNVLSTPSSQFLSGLMLALPYLRNEASIKLDENIFYSDYIKPTADVQSKFGVNTALDSETLTVRIPAGGYKRADYDVEGDYSLAAFYLVAGAIGDGVTVDCLPSFSHQAERRIVNILSDCGAKVIQTDSFVSVSRDMLHPIDVDCADIPHLVPILAVLGAYINGKSRLSNCGSLHYNESDRISEICSALTSLGADIEAVGGDIIIIGRGSLDGGSGNDYGDHRIAMALSVAAAFADDESALESNNTVNKSYPAFFSDFQKLGGKCKKMPNNC